MTQRKQFFALTALRPYGMDLLQFSLLTYVPQRQALSLALVETLVLRFFFVYASSVGGKVNRYFFFLLSQKKAYKIDFAISSFFTYNQTTVALVRQSLFFFLKQLKTHRRILFIADNYTKKLFNIGRLNYLFWSHHLYPTLAPLSDLKYYYNNVARASAIKQQLTRLKIDCIVFCAHEYHRINPHSFKELGRATVGLVGADTRPDLFDYAIPVAGAYSFTVSWVIALTLFSQSIN